MKSSSRLERYGLEVNMFEPEGLQRHVNTPETVYVEVKG
jgi:hypothetical protein